MAIQYWQDMSILADGLELAGHGKSVNLGTEVAPLDTTPLNTTGWTTLVGGLKSGTVNLELMQDLAAGSIDATTFAQLGVATTQYSICTASADGSKAYLFRGIPLSYTPQKGNVGDLATTTVSGSATAGVVRGRLIHPSNVTRTTSSVGTGRQFVGGVIAGKSMYAALHVLSVSGTTPTLTVIVQSDDNAGFTTPTTRITFSSANAVSAQWGTVAGAITDDYWRISYTITGTTPVFGFAVTVGIL